MLVKTLLLLFSLVYFASGYHVTPRVAAIAKTNGARMARGLPPLPPHFHRRSTRVAGQYYPPIRIPNEPEAHA